jgi:predicted DNA-binding transcriptional regulator YafY
MRLTVVSRQWRVLYWLAGVSQGLTLRELASRCGYCQRTIRRDVQALRAAGFDLEWNDGCETFGRESRIVLPIGHRERADVLRGMSVLRPQDAQNGDPR